MFGSGCFFSNNNYQQYYFLIIILEENILQMWHVPLLLFLPLHSEKLIQKSAIKLYLQSMYYLLNNLNCDQNFCHLVKQSFGRTFHNHSDHSPGHLDEDCCCYVRTSHFSCSAVVMAQTQQSDSESESNPEEVAPSELGECVPWERQIQESHEADQTQEHLHNWKSPRRMT